MFTVPALKGGKRAITRKNPPFRIGIKLFFNLNARYGYQIDGNINAKGKGIIEKLILLAATAN